MAWPTSRAIVERMDNCEHSWTTASSHPTSEGWVSYQRCRCGAVRAMLNSETILTRQS